MTSPAGVDDTGQQGKGTGTLLGAGPLAEEPGNHPVPQGPFRFVIGQRQIYRARSRLNLLEGLEVQGQ